MEIKADPSLIAYCGLYCGACREYRKGKCSGCRENEKATWCKIRPCCREQEIPSCADCGEELMACKKFNNPFSKFFFLVLRVDRPACIKSIREIGPEAYARQMAASGQQALKRKKSF